MRFLNIQNSKLKIGKKASLFAIPFVIAAAGIILFSPKSNLAASVSLKSKNFQSVQKTDSIDLTNPGTYKDLPVADVKNYKVSNSWGTVIYIPQYHKNPGTTSEDPKNDSAQVAQEEIYKILTFLVDKPKVNFVMAEGDLYGEVPAEKIGNIADKIQKENTLVSSTSDLEKSLQKKSIDPSLEKNVISDMHKEEDGIERDVILTGAPFKLKAEGKDITLYGNENQDTLSQSADLARNYIYLQDRMDQLNSNSYAVSNNTSNLIPTDQNSSEANYLQNLIKLLSGLKRGSNINSELSALEQEASSKGDKELVGQIQKVEKAYADSTTPSNISTAAQNTASSGSSRADNPYADIMDKRQIQNMMNDTENKINVVVVDKRNKEAAANFASALKSQNKNLGILQFGAGHEKGLVSELNKQGLSVVVIKSKEVLRRNLRPSS